MSEFIYDKYAVGDRIRKQRERLAITQENLAERIERSWRLVADIERGAAGMSMETLFRLCNALRVTPNDLLLPGGNPEDGEEAELAGLVDALKNSPARVRAGAIDILRAYLRSV